MRSMMDPSDRGSSFPVKYSSDNMISPVRQIPFRSVMYHFNNGSYPSRSLDSILDGSPYSSSILSMREDTTLSDAMSSSGLLEQKRGLAPEQHQSHHTSFILNP